MTARQQLARLLPLTLLILLGIAGLHGGITAPHRDGPLRAYSDAIGIALEIVLGVLLVITVRRDRAARSGVPAAADGQDRADVPARLRLVLIWLLSAGMLALAIALLIGLGLHLSGKGKALVPARRPPATIKPPPSRKLPPGTFRIPLGPILWALLIALLVAAVALSIWWASRQRRPAAARRTSGFLAEDSAGLRDAVESGRAALARLDDAQAAIIACYAAMESTLADRGTAREAADTPDELLARAVAGGILHGVAADAAGELTTLFYEARFSSHPLSHGQRDAARVALEHLAAQLAQPARPAEAAR